MDTKTWWIIIAILVVIVILVLIAMWQGKRRAVARREEVRELRGQAKGNETTVAEAGQRAADATAAAERARAAADAQEEKARKLEAEAEFERNAAAAIERDHTETLRRADRLDPDTPTDRAGNRIQGAGAGGGTGESPIDPATGRPVEEAVRHDDPPRADKLAEPGSGDVDDATGDDNGPES
ncbi:hypothetical protein [Flexivirga oryzae]|uniref:FtsZ-interacting cell division protein ZipA n=1 Tax=Flexivirga oryzae TaxID=1794944 RepID=A0A839N193_9MICO|nr:hypothetical protein [Flexivirga oryzae]MBB2891478.1 FtsZ-interacting cell division protein ZipA [Flexivirga oryzae]